MIAQFTAEFGINSTSNALNSMRYANNDQEIDILHTLEFTVVSCNGKSNGGLFNSHLVHAGI